MEKAKELLYEPGHSIISTTFTTLDGAHKMSHPFENHKFSPRARTLTMFQIHGMEDYYLGVVFQYSRTIWNGCVPLVSKYQGVEIPLTMEDVEEWVLKCYSILEPSNNSSWQTLQREFWAKTAAAETENVFNALNGNGSIESVTQWLCRKCGPVPKCNPQPAARIKKLKQMGYFIGTQKMQCPSCGTATFFDILIRLPRHAADNERRYSISIRLQKRIKNLLDNYDVCFDETRPPSELIIDHKFPSSRWVQGETVNEPDMPDDQIREKFQLLTNQANLQKERYCKRCVIRGIRGDYFGIKWFYKGDDHWRGTSKADESGCEGCCWYDMAEWKRRFAEKLAKERGASVGDAK